jgi:hypothetical protein
MRSIPRVLLMLRWTNFSRGRFSSGHRGVQRVRYSEIEASFERVSCSVLNRPGRTAGRTGRPAMVQSSPLFLVDCDDPVRDFQRTGRPGPNFRGLGLSAVRPGLAPRWTAQSVSTTRTGLHVVVQVQSKRRTGRTGPFEL